MTRSHFEGSSDRKSLVEDLERVDPSIAEQLLNLSRNPPRYESPKATHGSHRKHQRMLRAQKAAALAAEEEEEEARARSGDGKGSNGSGGGANPGAGAKPGAGTEPGPPAREGLVHGIGESHADEAAAASSLPPSRRRAGGSRRHAALPMNHSNEHSVVTPLVHTPKTKSKTKGKGKGKTKSKTKTKGKTKSKGKGKGGSPTGQAAGDPGRELTGNYTDRDILLGLAKFNNHPGNRVYRETVMRFRDESDGTKNKNEIAREIMDHIYGVIGGRFLKIEHKNSQRWYVMSDADVMVKVGKAISELKKSSVRRVSVGAPRANPSSDAELAAALAHGGSGDLEALQARGRPKRKASALSSRTSYFVDDTAEDPPQAAASGRRRKKKKATGTGDKAEETLPCAPRAARQPPQPSRAYQEYIYEPDPNDTYVEETAHVYHNPPFPSEWTNGVTRDDLRPIPPPPLLPDLPNSGACRWSFDEATRVLRADFSVGRNQGKGRSSVVTLEDSKFLFQMYERDDITVVSRGLLNMSRIEPSLWSLEYLRKCVGREFYHKFRRFDRTVDENGIVSNLEKDVLYSMRFEDYVRYCEKRESYLNERAAGNDNGNDNGTAQDEPQFTFCDYQGKTHTIGVRTSALYMIDVDMSRLVPLLNDNFLESFELPAVLPGGSHCMMNSVTPEARPFMGPNLYVTPPASFTHFHQDGHGTVDSGHLCISGYNEVVMLRRLTERHKKHALWILSGSRTDDSHFDGLYSMPHGDGLGKKPPWPTKDMLEDCRKMGYCPSVLILEPGDLVHINKGRLHAFRKMSTSGLPDKDCHFEQRKTMVASKGISGEEKMCVSVAWDWMYRGISPAGINREVCAILEGSTLNRKNNVSSLAIPELALLQMAKTIPARGATAGNTKSFLDALKKEERQTNIYESSKEDICRGINPGLSVVVGQHMKALNVEESTSTEKGERLSIAKIPDTQENPQSCALDPYGSSDFQCKLCSKELSNVYFHCDGCEKLLSKDFNICRGCYLQGEFLIKVQMHPSNPKRHATLNHMGDNKFSRESRCPCKNGPACNFCGYCLGCSCRCHTWFTMRTRLCDAEDEEKLLRSVRCTIIPESPKPSVVGDGDNKREKGVFGMEETTQHLVERLKDAGDKEWLSEDRADDVPEQQSSSNEANGVTVADGNSEEMARGENGKGRPGANEDGNAMYSDVRVKVEDSQQTIAEDMKVTGLANGNTGKKLQGADRTDDADAKKQCEREWVAGSNVKNDDAVV